MKIETSILKDYINKVSLCGTIPMIDLNFTDKGVTTNVKDYSQVAITSGLLKREAFQEYEEIADIYIKNSRMLLEILKTFSGIITLEKIEDSMIKILGDNRNVHIMLAEKKICDNLLEDGKPEIEAEVIFKVDKKVLSQTVNDMKLLDVISVLFVKNNGSVNINIGKKKTYDFINNTNICDSFIKGEDKEGIEVGVSGKFKEVVNSLGESVILKLATNKPLVFEDKNDNMEVSFIVASFIDNTE